MLTTKVSLVPTVVEDLDAVLAMETSSENSQYVGHWERDRHAAAIADTNIAHFKVVLGNKTVGYVILLGIHNPDQSIQLQRIAIKQKGFGFGRQTICLIVVIPQYLIRLAKN